MMRKHYKRNAKGSQLIGYATSKRSDFLNGVTD